MVSVTTLKWQRVVQELKSAQDSLLDLEKRKESYDVIFVQRQYVARLCSTLHSLTPYYFQACHSPVIWEAAEVIKEAATQHQTKAEGCRTQAKVLMDEAEAADRKAKGLQAVYDCIAARRAE